MSAVETKEPTLPREIAPNVHWLGRCVRQNFHSHQSPYVVVGESKTFMVDTSNPGAWPAVNAQLDLVLGARPLDYLFPTHAEVPHYGNLRSILDKYPACKVVGDVRDLHVFRPAVADRLVMKHVGDEIDLGGGYKITYLPAIFRDLPTTLWAYESKTQVMFVADGFAFTHAGVPAGYDNPVHISGECAMTTSELSGPVTLEKISFILKAALYHARYLDMGPSFERLARLLEKYPTKVIASTHGNVIDDLAPVLPVTMEAYRQVFGHPTSW